MQFMNKSDWSKVWDSKIVKLQDLFWRPIIWITYKRFIRNLNLSNNSKILELGCGIGRNSLKISKIYDCKVTLVDNCETALKRAKFTFQKNNTKANFINKDIFKLKLKEEFDLVFSEGLIEHYTGKDRRMIFKIHKNLTKKEGHVLILAPHLTKTYRFFKSFYKSLKLWRYKELPFSEKEIIDLCKGNNLKIIKILKPFFGSWIAVLAQRV
jgi:cyclopropane fatty-acyl-phospholipid synthase-like methyltransferase